MIGTLYHSPKTATDRPFSFTSVVNFEISSSENSSSGSTRRIAPYCDASKHPIVRSVKIRVRVVPVPVQYVRLRVQVIPRDVPRGVPHAVVLRPQQASLARRRRRDVKRHGNRDVARSNLALARAGRRRHRERDRPARDPRGRELLPGRLDADVHRDEPGPRPQRLAVRESHVQMFGQIVVRRPRERRRLLYPAHRAHPVDDRRVEHERHRAVIQRLRAVRPHVRAVREV
eukprot:29643-Pelagococcus_subviridis.AAC.2